MNRPKLTIESVYYCDIWLDICSLATYLWHSSIPDLLPVPICHLCSLRPNSLPVASAAKKHLRIVVYSVCGDCSWLGSHSHPSLTNLPSQISQKHIGRCNQGASTHANFEEMAVYHSRHNVSDTNLHNRHYRYPEKCVTI